MSGRLTPLLREVGLHPAQELVMRQLWDRGRMRQTDLARHVGADAELGEALAVLERLEANLATHVADAGPPLRPGAPDA
ncbi:hypothetical protein ACFY64_34375 [Streptomyces collinus]|uniref:hypothetical protein n=1 Tax=Streptomyces collinus TaxID=42684 RepID=UPI0036AC0F9D